MSEKYLEEELKRPEMKQCSGCGIKFPQDILSTFFSTFITIENCCGICALRLSNKLHNTRRKKFDGTLAEEYR